MMRNVSAGLFGTFEQTAGTVRFEGLDGVLHEIVVREPPLWTCWGMLFLVCAICLALLSRKVKAYEVVK